MKIFVSYASEDQALAEATVLSLRGAGHQVFFDRNDLPAGESYDVQILEAIEQSDLMIFLLSPESIEQGAYALTELGFARKRWPNPDRRVFPVVVRPVTMEVVPQYLRAVTFLQPEGNVAAEVVAVVQALSGWRRLRRRVGVAVLVGVLLGGGIAIAYLSHQVDQGNCNVAATNAHNVASRMLDLLVDARSSERVLGERLDAVQSKPISAYRAGREVDASEQAQWDREASDANWQNYALSVSNDRRMLDIVAQGQLVDLAFRNACGIGVDDRNGWQALLNAENLRRDDFQRLALRLQENSAEFVRTR